eukprot:g11239.t1
MEAPDKSLRVRGLRDRPGGVSETSPLSASSAAPPPRNQRRLGGAIEQGTNGKNQELMLQGHLSDGAGGAAIGGDGHPTKVPDSGVLHGCQAKKGAVIIVVIDHGRGGSGVHGDGGPG